MKYTVLCTLFLAAILTWITCAAQKKMAYEFPPEMAPAVKEGLIKLCDKGQILYAINCARCHNQVVGKKEIIPDFTPEQLGSYSIRVANAEHEDQMSETSVSAEELGLITTFLSYKKKNEPVKK